MKRYFFLLLLCFSTCIVFSQSNNWFTIKAFLPRWNGAEISVFSNERLIYTGTIVKDMFAFTGSIETPTQGSLKVKAGRNSFFIPVFLEPGTIKIRDAGGRVLVSYGTPSNDLYVQLNNNFDSLAVQKKISSFSEALQYKRNLATSFILNNPSSLVSVQFLKDYYYLALNTNDTLYFSLVHSLDSSLQQSFYAKEMITEATTRYATAIGKKAPLMQLPDSSRRLNHLYKSGEYTLINFWASWCAPCRIENHALVKLFTKYQDLGFSISSISLDTNKLLWLAAIKQDKLLWQQLSDLKGWESTVTATFGIKVIPMNFLVDKEGIIVEKNVQPEEIESFLANRVREQK
jgi:thiol-disulfide isomerase/thioredoxin